MGWVRPRNRVLHGHAHWRHMANTVERLYSGYAECMSQLGLPSGVTMWPVPKLFWQQTFVFVNLSCFLLLCSSRKYDVRHNDRPTIICRYTIVVLFYVLINRTCKIFGLWIVCLLYGLVLLFFWPNLPIRFRWSCFVFRAAVFRSWIFSWFNGWRSGVVLSAVKPKQWTLLYCVLNCIISVLLNDLETNCADQICSLAVLEYLESLTLRTPSHAVCRCL